jgi:pyruvate kinase
MMLAKIAAFTETHRPRSTLMARRELLEQRATMTGEDRMSSVVEHALDTVPVDLGLVPTRSGATARILSRCKPSVWLVAPSPDAVVCQGLAFSYGVYPVENHDEDIDWREFIENWLRANSVTAKRVMLVAGPSTRHPNANHRIELMRLDA